MNSLYHGILFEQPWNLAFSNGGTIAKWREIYSNALLRYVTRLNRKLSPLPTPQSLSTPVRQDIYFPTFFAEPWFMTADRFHRFLWSRSRNNELFPFPIYPPLPLPIRTRWKWDFANLETNLIFSAPFSCYFYVLCSLCTLSLSLSFFLSFSLSFCLRKRVRVIFGAQCILRFLVKWLSFVFVYPNLISRSSNGLYIYIYIYRIVPFCNFYSSYHISSFF